VANRILGGVDEFFTRADSTGASSPVKDAPGSVLALTNSSGNITTQYGYDPFGNTTSSGGTSTNVFQYTGRENDGNGLYFYRARYYSPTFGRFISEDPIGFFGGDANLYRYVWNSPTDFADPFGTWGVGVAGGGSAGGGLGWGGGSTGGAGVGVFGGGGGGVNAGVTGTTGSFAGGENHGVAYPGLPQGGPNGALGAYAGFGGGGFVTNATSACQLQGPFDTFIFNFWVGEFQYSSSGKVWTSSVTVGPGAGAGISYSSTTTVAKTLAGRSCGC
jgi:RHS repeat-associated protein